MFSSIFNRFYMYRISWSYLDVQTRTTSMMLYKTTTTGWNVKVCLSVSCGHDTCRSFEKRRSETSKLLKRLHSNVCEVSWLTVQTIIPNHRAKPPCQTIMTKHHARPPFQTSMSNHHAKPHVKSSCRLSMPNHGG